jgi:hypothetical protein
MLVHNKQLLAYIVIRAVFVVLQESKVYPHTARKEEK